MQFLIKILVSALAIYLVALIMPHVQIDDQLTVLLVALVLAFLDAIVKPLLTILTIPITIFTFGFFLLAINAFIILIATRLVPGFHVDGFWWALLFSLILSITNGFLNSALGINRLKEREDRENDSW
ncbi:MAG: phage holin family protein [Bacteroidia bacterium]|nr:phage holin family protein [Bacteroidia bacterium]